MTVGRWVIEREPRVGGTLRQHVRAGRFIRHARLDEPRRIERRPFFLADGPEGVRCEQERFMRSAAALAYTSEPVEAFAFADLDVLNSEGVLLLDGAALSDTVDFVDPSPADASVEWARPYEYLKLRAPLPIGRVIEGPVLIGYAAAWRNYGHWLLQCMPKLVAFLVLRDQVPGLRVALPPLPPDTAFRQTLDLLGIAGHEVLTLPTGAATRFAEGWVIANPSIWDILPLTGTGADLIAARVGPPEDGAGRVYLHRAGGTRCVTNFAAVRALVERHGFVVRSFEAATLPDQVRTLRAARHVICEHGAACTNILFSRPGARVLQLFNPVFVEPCFWSIASLRGLDYGYVVGRSVDDPQAPPPDHNSSYEVPLDRLEAALAVLFGEAVAMPPRPAEPALPAVSGLVHPDCADTVLVAQFGQASRDERLLLLGPADAGPPAAVLNEADLPPAFRTEHHHAPASPAVHAYALHDAQMWGHGLIVRDGRFVMPADCLPGYLRGAMTPAVPRLPDGYLPEATDRRCDMPVLVALHPNLTYGHFLNDMLPRLYLAAVLRQMGTAFLLALPQHPPRWLEPFVRLLGLRDGIIRYDPARDRLHAPAILLPAMMQTDGYPHPAISVMVDRITAGLPPSPAGPTRLFLAGSLDGDGHLRNAAEVAAVLAQEGFVTLDAQPATLLERLALLTRAEVIVGDSGVGLADAMFAPAGARVVALNFSSHHQSAIARVRRHRMAFLPPRDDVFRHWRLSADRPADYEIDPLRLRALLRRIQAAG